MYARPPARLEHNCHGPEHESIEDASYKLHLRGRWAHVSLSFTRQPTKTKEQASILLVFDKPRLWDACIILTLSRYHCQTIQAGEHSIASDTLRASAGMLSNPAIQDRPEAPCHYWSSENLSLMQHRMRVSCWSSDFTAVTMLRWNKACHNTTAASHATHSRVSLSSMKCFNGLIRLDTLNHLTQERLLHCISSTDPPANFDQSLAVLLSRVLDKIVIEVELVLRK